MSTFVELRKLKFKGIQASVGLHLLIPKIFIIYMSSISFAHLVYNSFVHFWGWVVGGGGVNKSFWGQTQTKVDHRNTIQVELTTSQFVTKSWYPNQGYQPLFSWRCPAWLKMMLFEGLRCSFVCLAKSMFFSDEILFFKAIVTILSKELLFLSKMHH